MTKTIFVTDDQWRPSYGGGMPSTPSPMQISTGGSGNSDVYVNYRVTYETGSSLQAKFSATCMIFSDTANSSTDVRATLEISTDDFSTIKYTGTLTSIKPLWHSMTWEYYSRDNVSNYGRIERRGALISLSASLPVSNVAYKVRLKNFQYKLSGGSWTSAGNVTKVYSSYAPFVQSVTKPSAFYLNGLNTFTSSIAAKYTSEFEWSINKSVLTNGPVRNQSYPYIKTGTATSNIYWACCNYNVSDKSNPNCNYTMTVKLFITDPSDSNYKIQVSETEVTGACSYKSTDDKSMFTATMTATDPSGHETTYGSLLRNTDSMVRFKAVLTQKYGVRASVIFNGSGLSNYAAYDGQESKTLTKDVYVPASGSTCTAAIYVKWGSTTILSFSKSFSIIDYSAPSFSALAIHRTNQDGTANDVGNYCRIDWGVVITPLGNQNSKKLTIRHPSGTQSYNPLSSYTQSGQLTVAASTEIAYDITCTLQDDLTTVTRTLRLSTASVIMDWLYGGRGVAFGKVASKQDTLEVSPDWKLIASQMMLSGTDLVKWVKQITTRMEAIETFARNSASTTQYQVSFYNGSELVKRQWVRSGADATAPTTTPEKASTTTETFSFVGWALSNNQTTADAGALANITSYRSVYAAFSSATRYYSIFYYNGGTLLTTLSNQTYHSSGSYSGTPSGSGTFAGFSPTGKYIEDSVACYAQFYTETEITDSWAQIIAAVEDGTYMQKYKLGQYKPLVLDVQDGEEVLDGVTPPTLNMQIVGFKMDQRTDRNKKAAITFISKNLLDETHRYNPAQTTSTETKTVKSWVKYYTSESTGTTRWKSQNNGNGTVAKATLTLTITSSGSTSGLSFNYWRDSGAAGTLQIKFGGTTYFNGTVTTSTQSTGKIAFGTDTTPLTRTVELTFTSSGTAEGAAVYVEIQAGWVELGSTVTKIVETSNSDTSQTVTVYDLGTGVSGGWYNSELRTYVRGTVRSKIPATVRNAIKSVYKYTHRMDKYGEALVNSRTTETIWIPSYAELFGYDSYEYTGPEYASTASLRVKKKGSSATTYYLRSIAGSYAEGVSSSGSHTSMTPTTASGVCIGFCI